MEGASRVLAHEEFNGSPRADGPTTADLRRAYASCRGMQRRHDPTFWLATLLLPKEIRPATWALYGFVRSADEIVDGPDRFADPAARLAGIDLLAHELGEAREGRRVETEAVNALVDAAVRHSLPLDELTPYLDSMRRDVGPLWITDWEDLLSYMEGSAGSVGRLMAPILKAPAQSAESFARLGLAFQLTNFIRDIPEDSSLGRVYLPADELAAAGVSVSELGDQTVPASPQLRGVIERQVSRAREFFAQGYEASRSLSPRVQRGIRLATTVYERTLDRVESSGFDAISLGPQLPVGARIAAVASALRS